MPLQLLNLGTIVPRVISRMFFTRTPRGISGFVARAEVEFSLLSLLYRLCGVERPTSDQLRRRVSTGDSHLRHHSAIQRHPASHLDIWCDLLRSWICGLQVQIALRWVSSPRLLLGVSLYSRRYTTPVFYKPYESRGQAWPITFNRLVWGVIIFQVFMIGIFTLSAPNKRGIVLPTLMTPLLLFTGWWAWYMDKKFTPLSQHVSLEAVCEVQRGETDEISRLRDGELVSSSHT